MNIVTVREVTSDYIRFSNGDTLTSDHESECCEHHWLAFEDLTLDEFKGLEFDLSSDTFFKKIIDYGIELISIKGYSVKIAGHGSNNGYYSTNLTLVLDGLNFHKEFDITDCQDIDY